MKFQKNTSLITTEKFQPIELVIDLWRQQLICQANWYATFKNNLRKVSMEKVKKFFILIQKYLAADVFVEIGAHEANFSKSMKTTYSNAIAIAFEANPYVYQKYKDSVIKIGVIYENMAISDQTNYINFGIQQVINGKHIENTAGLHSIMERTDSDKVQHIRVQSTTLTAYFKKNCIDANNVCLWIDAEGAASLVLKGAKQILEKVSSIYIEVESLEYWKNQWTETYIYKYFLDNGFIPILRDFEYVHQYNMVLVKKNKFTEIEREFVAYMRDVN